MSIVLGPLANRDFKAWLLRGNRASTITATEIGSLTAWTWEFWFRPNGTPTSGVLWQGGPGGVGAAHMRFSVNGSSQVVLDNRDEGGPTLTSTTALADGVWTHIAGGYAGGFVALWINAVSEGLTSGASWTSTNLWSQPSGATFGEYCDPRIWGIGRSTAQIAADYGGPLTGSETDLIGYWPGDGEGNSTPNVVGSYANMQTQGGDWTWVFASQPFDVTAPTVATSASPTAPTTDATAQSSPSSLTAPALDASPQAPANVISISAPAVSTSATPEAQSGASAAASVVSVEAPAVGQSIEAPSLAQSVTVPG